MRSSSTTKHYFCYLFNFANLLALIRRGRKGQVTYFGTYISIFQILEHILSGEIGGVGLALGYINNDARTELAFASNRHAHDEYIENGWTTVYRTGDRVRIEGNSLFVEGRLEENTQIKFRGMRVNLRDIEVAILKTAKGSLSEVVVSVRALGKEGSESLVGHVIFGSDTPADPEAFLRGLLGDLPLPQYMCPKALVQVEEMPRTISGKLDRRAVESLSMTHPSADVAAKRPMSTIESQLKEIWKNVLSHGPHNLEDISTESDFFEMDGTSMRLLEVQAQTRKRLNTSLMVVDLFNSCTLYSMAHLIEHKSQV